jgi:hypothetical protein
MYLLDWFLNRRRKKPSAWPGLEHCQLSGA